MSAECSVVLEWRTALFLFCPSRHSRPPLLQAVLSADTRWKLVFSVSRAPPEHPALWFWAPPFATTDSKVFLCILNKSKNSDENIVQKRSPFLIDKQKQMKSKSVPRWHHMAQCRHPITACHWFEPESAWKLFLCGYGSLMASPHSGQNKSYSSRVDKKWQRYPFDRLKPKRGKRTVHFRSWWPYRRIAAWPHKFDSDPNVDCFLSFSTFLL